MRIGFEHDGKVMMLQGIERTIVKGVKIETFQKALRQSKGKGTLLQICEMEETMEQTKKDDSLRK